MSHPKNTNAAGANRGALPTNEHQNRSAPVNPAQGNCTTDVIQAVALRPVEVTHFAGERTDVCPAARWTVPSFEPGYRALAARAPGLPKSGAGYITGCTFRGLTIEDIDHDIEPRRQRNAARDGRSYQPLSEAHRARLMTYGYRAERYVEAVTALFVDQDGCPQMRPDFSPEAWPCGIVAHSTHSYHPETQPGSWRVAMPLSRTCTAAEGKRLVRALRGELQPGANLRSIVQPAFLPTCPAGGAVDVMVVPGPPVDVDAWLARTPETDADRIGSGVQGWTEEDLADAEEQLKRTEFGRAYLFALRAGTAGLAVYGSGETNDGSACVYVRSVFADEYTTPTAENHCAIVGDAGAGGVASFHGTDKADPAGLPRTVKHHFGKLRELCPALVRAQGWAGLDGLDPDAPLPQADAADELAPVPLYGGAGCDPAVDTIIAQLARPEVGVFQRSGRLCCVVREPKAVEANDGTRKVVRPEGAPSIREIPAPRLREIVRVLAGEKAARLAPDVAARGEWAHVRPLDAIATYPVMRADGSILLESGYDPATRTFAEIDVRVTVPDQPTQTDAQAARLMLEDIVRDFDFVQGKEAVQKSAWLAMLLTVLARPAVDGPTPLGLFEASQRGSGKTLLADVIANIATGRDAPRRVCPKSKEEWDKTMLAILLGGDPLMLIDNVTTMLSSDALDAVLTGTSYVGRLLGVSEDRRVAVRTVFMASSNNARVSTDLVRRTVACRIEPQVERPEERQGFKYPDLLRYVRENRAQLLGAALTILRAYVVAGRPAAQARAMGSYGAWCRVVRDALVWAGGADPAATQDDLRESADVERDELRDLLTAWHRAFGDKAVTVRAVLDKAVGLGSDPQLRDALRGIMPAGVEPSAHMVGNKLRALRGQIVGGLALRSAGRDDHTKVARYRVGTVTAE